MVENPITYLPQPLEAEQEVVILECPGTNDKNILGYRVDSIPIGNELIKLGIKARVLQYTDFTAPAIYNQCLQANGKSMQAMNFFLQCKYTQRLIIIAKASLYFCPIFKKVLFAFPAKSESNQIQK